MFRHQRRRMISVAMKSEVSSSSNDETSDEDLGKAKSMAKLQAEWQPLQGYTPKTDLDRVLLKGIFNAPKSKKKKKSLNHDMRHTLTYNKQQS